MTKLLQDAIRRHLVILLIAASPVAAIADVRVPPSTKVLLETTQEIVARKRDYSVGDIIHVRVWRDVVVEGQTVIAGGTPATIRVDSIKGRGIVGRKGKVQFGAVDTRAVDGQRINLTGGYGKEGKGRVAMTATVGALLFFPVLFVPGGVPKFPAGTVFEAYVDGSYVVDTPDANRPVVNLAGRRGLRANIDYSALSGDDPEYFTLELAHPAGVPRELVVDSVNGQAVDPIAVQIISGAGTASGKGIVSINELSRYFRKGINRFEVAHMDGGSREATEIIMEIQF